MSEKYIQRARRNDRIARWIITTGGIAIIATVVLILVLIVEVTVPLFLPASSKQVSVAPLPGNLSPDQVLALEVDEYLKIGAAFTRSGTWEFFDLSSGSHIQSEQVEGGTALSCTLTGLQQYSVLWEDGTVSLVQPVFRTVFDDAGVRSTQLSARVHETVPPEVDPDSLRSSTLRKNDDGVVTRLDLLKDNTFRIAQRSVTVDFLNNETVESFETLIDDVPSLVTAYTLDGAGEWLFAGTEDGQLLRWGLGTPGEAKLYGAHKATPDGAPVTALSMVFGDSSVAVGDGNGDLSTWFPVRKSADTASKLLTRIHNLKKHDSAVQTILSSQRNKSLISLDADGSIHLDYPTSERSLLTLEGVGPGSIASYALRANGVAALSTAGDVSVWSIHNPHPEISFATLFGKVWYEGYDEPEFSWQSSASSDDFETKISLIPLLFGSIKGTFYAMLYAVPLALFGAVYTSHFAKGAIRNTIKSTVEIMAAIPSVVIGFLAALWLAPVIEQYTVTFLVGIAIVPILVVIFVLAIQPLRQTGFIKRVEQGYEFVLMIPMVMLACWLSYMIAGPLESVLFSGDFKQWLFESAGQRYDQRNCIVIAFALGFAVIPIIFTIAEDALSNVPNSLKAASLALGASRWQTVWRVVLPSASPGIFAGIIIGFGRAVGETMIVLMATGNTPVLDPSIFNGMRTLSANIAVEIPEAPHGGTLYRVLFLSAVILLVFTSILNTMAELIRQRLRSKYGLNS